MASRSRISSDWVPTVISAVFFGLLVTQIPFGKAGNRSVPTPTTEGQKPPLRQQVDGSVTIFDFDQDGRIDAAMSPANTTLQLVETQSTDWPAVVVPAASSIVVAGIAFAAGRRSKGSEKA